MICKICGCEMKNNGDWFACPTCGSVHFGPDTDENKRVEKPVIKPVEVKEEPIKKQELFDESIMFLIKELEDQFHLARGRAFRKDFRGGIREEFPYIRWKRQGACRKVGNATPT